MIFKLILNLYINIVFKLKKKEKSILKDCSLNSALTKQPTVISVCLTQSRGWDLMTLGKDLGSYQPKLTYDFMKKIAFILIENTIFKKTTS